MLNMKKKETVAILLVLIALSLYSIIPNISSKSVKKIKHPFAGETIQIGLTSSTTAGLVTTIPLAEIIQQDINEYYEKLDVTFEFVVKDNQGSDAVALQNTKEYRQQGIDLIVGHGWSSQSLAALAYANQKEMILLSPSSTTPILAIPDDMFFRTCPTDFVQGPAIAAMWSTWGVKAVLTMHRADAWGDGIWNVLEPLWEDYGIVDLGRIRYADEVTEFSMHLSQANDIIEEAAAEYGGLEYVGMQFFVFDEGRTIQTQAADYPNLIDLIWMSTEGAGRGQPMLDEAGEWATQTRHFSSLMRVDEHNFQWKSFEESYFDSTGQYPTFYAGATYDACWLLAKTVMETGSLEADVIAEMLVPMSHKFHGVTGWLSLDENGDRQPQMFDIWGFYESDDGEYMFRKWGEYNGQAIDVTWDDAALLEYAGLTRPALGG